MQRRISLKLSLRAYGTKNPCFFKWKMSYLFTRKKAHHYRTDFVFIILRDDNLSFFLLAIFVKNHFWKMIDTSKHFKESYRAAELFLCKKKVLKIWVVVAIVHNNAINFRTMKTLVSHVGVFRDFFCQGLGVDLSRVDMNGINMVTCCQSYYFSKVLQICYFPWIIA